MAIIHHYFVMKLSFTLQIPIIKRNKQVSYTAIQGNSKLDKPCDFPLISNKTIIRWYKKVITCRRSLLLKPPLRSVLTVDWSFEDFICLWSSYCLFFAAFVGAGARQPRSICCTSWRSLACLIGILLTYLANRSLCLSLIAWKFGWNRFTCPFVVSIFYYAI